MKRSTHRRAQRRIYPAKSEKNGLEEYRTDALVDRDRVWYSSEFRRLGGVTQVVPPQADYLFHDRLTHSIKVAQVAESIARYIEATTDGDELQRKHGLVLGEWIDPTYCYVAGLAHDIGHPPFGHAGEALLQEVAQRSQNPTLEERSFEGNAQSTRIVATLSFRQMPDKDGTLEGGLNPTLRSVAAIAKYPWLRGMHPSTVPKLEKKWSFYPEEQWILDDLIDEKYIAVETENVKLTRRRGPLKKKVLAVYRWPEAEIMDWADDISYAVHDLEDFYRASRLPLQSLAVAFSAAGPDTPWETIPFSNLTNDRETSSALEFCRERMVKILDGQGKSLRQQVPQAFAQIWLRYAQLWPKSPFDGSRASHVSLQKFASELITDLIEAASVSVVGVGSDVRLTVKIRPTDQLIAEFFKSLCQFYVIRSSNLTTMQMGQSLTLLRLFESLESFSLNWIATFDGESTVPDRKLPARLREYLDETMASQIREMNTDQIRAEVSVAIIDYLCSLRDQQAYLLAARVSGDQGVSWTGSWIDG